MSESEYDSDNQDEGAYNNTPLNMEREQQEKRLKLSRGVCKATFTKNETFFAKAEEVEQEDLRVRKKAIEAAYVKYNELTIELHILQNLEELEVDDFEDRYLKLCIIIERFQNVKASPISTNNNNVNVCNLPALDIPIFDGKDISQYLPFIEMYEAMVHTNQRLTDIQKLCYLKRCLRSEALQLIDNLPIIGASYRSAMELLKRRYDNPAILISNHVTQILDMPTLQKSTSAQLRDFSTKIRQHLTALQNMQVPVDQWDALLSNILMRKLDQYTVRLFHSERDSIEVVPVTELLKFLDKRALVLEASPGFVVRSNKQVSLVSPDIKGNDKNCSMCSAKHKLYICPKFLKLTPENRRNYVIKNKFCQTCLTSHNSKCRYAFKCSECSASHNTLIHVPDAIPGLSEETQVLYSQHMPLESNVILPTAKVLVTDAFQNKHVVRAVLDSGSQTSFCTTSLAKKLGLPLFPYKKDIMTLGQSQSALSQGINVTIQSMTQNFQMSLTCSVIDKITTYLPQVRMSNYKFPSFIQLADDAFNVPGEISLLLSADVLFRIIEDGKVGGDPGYPIFLDTRLGYIVSGNIKRNASNVSAVTMHTVTNPELEYCVNQFWEAERVPPYYQEALPEHEHSEQVFKDTVTLKNNKFEVKIPLKVKLQEIDSSNSFAIAFQRLHYLQKRFAKDKEYYSLYKDFIKEYLTLGHAKIIDINTCHPRDQPKFYLPHHAVLRPEKLTNKLRVVFDGSVKTKNGHSLNDIMCNGPVVQNSLFDILITFRKFKYTLQCDIRHMYRMISVDSDCKALQNILWLDNGILQHIQLQTITYGLKGSAFLATRCLIELARKFKSSFPIASEAIIEHSYVDDIQCGSDSIEDAIELKKQLIAIMELADFKLHKWVSNCPQILADVPQDKLGLPNIEIDQDKRITKILGLSYDVASDVFQVSGRVITATTKATKRNILSSISRLFDPMGLVGPVTLKAKLILQQIWKCNVDWDTVLPIEITKIWDEFYNSLSRNSTFSVSRYIAFSEAEEVELLGFCDASANAYGCCIFIKTIIKNVTSIHLLGSKSRVAPLQSNLTIPKLELNGALILAKFAAHIALLLNIKKCSLFCDSKVVLGWISGSTLKVPGYIGNRVREIHTHSNEMQWYYTPGLSNPADILSRGCDFQELIDCKLWIFGPSYITESSTYNLYLSEIEKPINLPLCCYSAPNNNIDNIDLLPVFEKFSSLSKMVRVTCYMLRFYNKCKGFSINTGFITVSEYRNSLNFIIKYIQGQYFQSELNNIANNTEIKTNLKALHPFVDNSGLLRVSGRLHRSNEKYGKKFPLILPKKCHFTKLIIVAEHLNLLHGGLKLVLSSLSQKYFIINSVREVKSVIFKCIICCRQKAECAKQLMGSLPFQRVNPVRAFERVGLDFCGPFEIRQSTLRRSIETKGYVAVFVCFTSKAVHLEVVSDMTTATFMAAFKRFISRRGLPTDIHCDNGSTFKCANKQLQDLFSLHNSKDFKEKVHDFSLQKGIQFHFIPEYSPNQGGLWEAAVKAVKFHFKRIVATSKFTYEQFNTILVEIEAILNSRPLMPLSQDLTDFSFLTPGHFLIGCSLTTVPQPDITDIPINSLRFWRCCEQIRQHFWKAWSRDYLATLNKRTRWQKEYPNLKEGMLVLLIELNSPPIQWPLGRIVKVHLGHDSKVRVVEIITADKKTHLRAISKIVILPVDDSV